MELGSPHDAIVEVAKSGVLLALEHNMLPKPILQEALRCADANRVSCASDAPSPAGFCGCHAVHVHRTRTTPSTCRPILTDLAFYNRINLRLLRHLHRLLVRCTSRLGAATRSGCCASPLLTRERVAGVCRTCCLASSTSRWVTNFRSTSRSGLMLAISCSLHSRCA